MPPFLVPHSLFASMIPKGNYDAEFLGTAAPLRVEHIRELFKKNLIRSLLDESGPGILYVCPVQRSSYAVKTHSRPLLPRIVVALGRVLGRQWS